MYLGGHIDVSAVAVDRVRDSDLGISAVAIDSAGGAWATSEYELDQERGQITVYPVTDNARVSSYLERISKKFPRNRIVEWAPPASSGGMPFTPK